MGAETKDRAPDFNGWATKFGIECSDGRVIHGGAFKDQDGQRVPLVYHHGHEDVGNVLGHVILHDRGDEGVYCDGFFNTSENGQHAKTAVENGDLTALSIYANRLKERSKQVMHGVIKEVSLVLSGANPGALIDNVQLQHSETGEDGQIQKVTVELDDEALIYMPPEVTELTHGDADEDVSHGEERTIQDVVDTLSPEQKDAFTYLVGAAAQGDEVSHADDAPSSGDGDGEGSKGKTIQEVVDTMNEEQRSVLDYLVGAALEEDGTEADDNATDDKADKKPAAAAHSDTDPEEEVITHMSRNVFEQAQDATKARKNVKEGGTALSHDDMKEILANGERRNSMKKGLEEFALQHGIHNIEALFPEARNYTQTPDWDSRRTEWVKGVLDACTKIPFARVKTMTADITQDEARAKGYIKGTFKEQEWFELTHRETSPATIYKKQQLDRDDIIDITDFDVVVWMKGEMRLMLEEEIARAILIGDGRNAGATDKIRDPSGASSGNGIRSILHDNDLYARTEYVSVTDNGSEFGPEIADRILESMVWYKGTPGPTFYTTLPMLTKMKLTRDGFGRRLWPTNQDIANELGVSNIVAVEVAETEPDLVGIIVNLRDYILGNDKGGEVNLFDDFDLDYNQFKYLIETRLSGALARIRAAVIIRLAEAGDVEVTPIPPQFNESTGVVTIPTVSGVTYKNASTNATVTGTQSAIAKGATVKYFAVPNEGSYFRDNQHDEYEFTRSND